MTCVKKKLLQGLLGGGRTADGLHKIGILKSFIYFAHFTAANATVLAEAGAEAVVETALLCGILWWQAWRSQLKCHQLWLKFVAKALKVIYAILYFTFSRDQFRKYGKKCIPPNLFESYAVRILHEVGVAVVGGGGETKCIKIFPGP